MADIHIHRPHHLGLKQARAVAKSWADQAEHKLGMTHTVERGEDQDHVHFTRSGVKGTLTISAHHYEIKAKLGLLLAAFKHTIEHEIEKELDQLMAGAKHAKKK